MLKLNPFQPNSPVSIGMFAGRDDEIIELENGLFRVKNGHASNYLLTGERGIGKSSLLMYLRHISNGRVQSIQNGKFNFLTIRLSISDKTDLATLVRLIEQNVKRELSKIEAIRNFLKESWLFVQRLRVMDSGIEKEDILKTEDIIIDELSHSLFATCNRITNPENDEEGKDGIVFLIDEADNACPELRLGYFFKTLTESLQSLDCNNIMFVLAGLPDLVEKLADSHESSMRIFTNLKVRILSSEDRRYVVDKGIEEANKKNKEKTTIDNKAKDTISSLSEGYPHFIQQFAYSAFDSDSDGEIKEEDVVRGAFSIGGAIDSIGDRYYAASYRDRIKSDEYREVLTIMAEEWNSWVKKSDIREKFSGDDSTLTNALKALTTRKIILKNTSKIGEYRLQQKGFALWIKFFGNRPN